MTAPAHSCLALDYASVDGNPPPDFHALYAAGFRIVYIRKSYSYRNGTATHLCSDTTYARDAQHARDAGFVVGAYAFWDFHKDAPDAYAQVFNFRTSGGDIVPAVDLPPCSDIEFPGNGVADTGRTQAECYSFAMQLHDALRTTYKCDPVTYTSHVEWCDTNGLGGPKDIGGRTSPLWQKIPYRLSAGHVLDQVAPRMPHHGPLAVSDPADLFRVPPPWDHDDPWLVQFQGDVQGLSGIRQADVSYFRYLDCSSQGWESDLRIPWVCKKLGVVVTELQDALRLFQVAHKLTPDCVIGPRTFAALAWQP